MVLGLTGTLLDAVIPLSLNFAYNFTEVADT